MVRRIWQIHADGKFCRYFILFVSNSAGISSTAGGIVRSLQERHPQTSFEHYGPKVLLSAISSEARIQENAKLQSIGSNILEKSDGDIRGIVASVSASSFVDAIKSSDGTSLKRHIFDENLRVFLGTNGGFNKQIIDTASSADSFLFWYLNNGITITCKKYSYNRGHAAPIIGLTDFQIVNGAQTSHSLFEAARAGGDILRDVVLLVRIYETDRTDVAERVAVATNSQARIQSRDLRANRPVLKNLELAFKEKGYFFERKRNMHASQPDDKRIDALKLGQVILAFYLKQPERSKSDSDAIFEGLFGQIFHENYNIEALVRLFDLYQQIETRRDEYDREFGSSETGMPEQYLLYGHWFILYAAGLLIGRREEKDIPSGEDAEELVDEAIKLVARACDQVKAVAHYQLFRSGRTKDKIVAELTGQQMNFFDLPGFEA